MAPCKCCGNATLIKGRTKGSLFALHWWAEEKVQGLFWKYCWDSLKRENFRTAVLYYFLLVFRLGLFFRRFIAVSVQWGGLVKIQEPPQQIGGELASMHHLSARAFRTLY